MGCGASGETPPIPNATNTNKDSKQINGSKQNGSTPRQAAKN